MICSSVRLVCTPAESWAYNVGALLTNVGSMLSFRTLSRAAMITGTLIFAGGELVFADAGGLTGEEALHELLTWEGGNFRVDYEPAPRANAGG